MIHINDIHESKFEELFEKAMQGETICIAMDDGANVVMIS